MEKGNAIFICAMNPPSVGGGRRSLPISLKNLLTNINLEALAVDELQSIVKIKYSEKINRLMSNNMDIVFKVHQ
jgi:midasin (ATPase involved in ribosome maturation)